MVKVRFRIRARVKIRFNVMVRIWVSVKAMAKARVRVRASAKVRVKARDLKKNHSVWSHSQIHGVSFPVMLLGLGFRLKSSQWQ